MFKFIIVKRFVLNIPSWLDVCAVFDAKHLMFLYIFNHSKKDYYYFFN